MSESVAAMEMAHVARNVVLTLICDVVLRKAALYRVSLSRDVTDSQMVRMPTHVTEATDMPDAHTAEPSGMTTKAAQMITDAAQATNVTTATEAAEMTTEATEAANMTAAKTADVTAATKAAMAATPTPARHG
jgi:hypothetical protein